jgi:hypothetical protein
MRLGDRVCVAILLLAVRACAIDLRSASSSFVLRDIKAVPESSIWPPNLQTILHTVQLVLRSTRFFAFSDGCRHRRREQTQMIRDARIAIAVGARQCGRDRSGLPVTKTKLPSFVPVVLK